MDAVGIRLFVASLSLGEMGRGKKSPSLLYQILLSVPRTKTSRASWSEVGAHTAGPEVSTPSRRCQPEGSPGPRTQPYQRVSSARITLQRQQPIDPLQHQCRNEARDGQRLAGLGNVRYRQGDVAEAQRLLEENLKLRRGQNDRRGIAYALGGLALIARAQGDLARAKALYVESLTLRQQQRDRQSITWCLIGMGGLAVELGQYVRAARIFGAVDAVRNMIGIVLTLDELRDYQRDLADLRTALGEATFTEAWAEGRALTLEQAVTEALTISAED